MDAPPKSLEEQIERNLEVAIVAMDAELARRIRVSNLESEQALRIRESSIDVKQMKYLQRKLFESFADRHIPESVKQEIKGISL